MAVSLDRWEEYVAPIPPEERGDLIADLPQAPDRRRSAEQLRAAKAWSRWKTHHTLLLPSPRHIRSHAADRAALAFARIENHYFVHAGFMEEGQLIRDAHKLHGIPGTIVQGRLRRVHAGAHRLGPAPRLAAGQFH